MSHNALPEVFINASTIIIAGPSGVGKTNIALNLARDLQKKDGNVTLIDLDVVNPYFRSGNSLDFLVEHDIRFLGPTHSATNLDTPSLQPGIDAAFATAADAGAPTVPAAADVNARHRASSRLRVVADIGGDADGARALARFVPGIMGGYDNRERQDFSSAQSGQDGFVFCYVCNFRRAMATTFAENLAFISDIQTTSGLAFTHLIANTHLKDYSNASIIASGMTQTMELSLATKLPIAAICVRHNLVKAVKQGQKDAIPALQAPIYPIDILVGAPWEAK